MANLPYQSTNGPPWDIHPKIYINPHFVSARNHGGAKSAHGNRDDNFLINFMWNHEPRKEAGGTMIGQNSQEGEIFAVSKLNKLYVDLTSLSDMNLMA